MSEFSALSDYISRAWAKLVPKRLPPKDVEAVPPASHGIVRHAHPPGHFYSPIPDLAEIRRREGRIFHFPDPPEIRGLNLRTHEQLALLDSLAESSVELPFQAAQTPGLRFYYENGVFGYSDALILCALLRRLRPRRAIEVGSGHSTALMLDADELILGRSLSLTTIDPHPDTLGRLLKPGDLKRMRLLETPVQDADLGLFDGLEKGDILFVDSSHVAKAGSDVNFLVFEVLPRLRPGVWIHFHDVFYPFEYPKKLIYDGLAWNELYLLRGFLQYNEAFAVRFFVNWLQLYHWDRFIRSFPLASRLPGGSLWLETLG